MDAQAEAMAVTNHHPTLNCARIMREIPKITRKECLPMSHRSGRCQVCDATRWRVLKRLLRRKHGR